MTLLKNIIKQNFVVVKTTVKTTEALTTMEYDDYGNMISGIKGGVMGIKGDVID